LGLTRSARYFYQEDSMPSEELLGRAPTSQANGGEEPTTRPGTGQDPAEDGAVLTPAQVQKMLEENTEQMKRYFQSQMDKRADGIVKRLRDSSSTQQKIAEQAKAQGLNEQQIAALQSSLMNDELTAILKEEEQRQEQARQAESARPSPEQIEARAMQLADRYELSGEDPESKLIQVNGTLEQYFDSIIEAGVEKRARLKREQDQPSNPRRSPGATVPGGRGVPNSAFGMSKGDLLDAELRNLASKR
jgi:hypothetical protein